MYLFNKIHYLKNYGNKRNYAIVNSLNLTKYKIFILELLIIKFYIIYLTNYDYQFYNN